MNLVELRMDFLVQFDHYIKALGDERIFEIWLMGGLPDGYDTADVREIAEDDELWLDCVKCFARCCRCAGVF